MTVPTSTAKSGPYAGAGTTGPFTVGFRFLENSHLQVIRTSSLGVDTTLALTTDYSVSGAGGASGTVTLVTALAVGEKLTVIRNVPFTQDADYVQNDAFPAESHERALDKLTMQTQQLAEEISRAATVPVTSDDAAGLAAAISTLATNQASVTTVANNIDDVVAVGDNIDSVNTTATNVASVTNFSSVYQGAKAVDPTLRNNLTALLAGDLYFNTAAGSMRVYSGASWSDVGTALPITVVEQTFNGTGAQTVFTLSSAPPYLTAVEVFLSGVRQVATTVYSVSGSTLTFTAAPPSGTANIYVRWLTPVAAGVPTDGSVTTAKIADAAVTDAKIAAMGAAKLTGDVAAARIVTALNASGSAPVYAARAWVNFNGFSIGTGRASGNVNSITDHDVGDYTVNFSTAMQDANYAVAFGVSYDLAGNNNSALLKVVALNTTSVRIRSYTSAGGSTDSSLVSVTVFR